MESVPFHQSFYSDDDEAQNHFNHIPLEHVSFSSQPSLPSVSSQYISTVHHHCITTIKGSQSSYISSLVLDGEFLYVGSSDQSIRSWRCGPDHEYPSNNIVAIGKGAVKSLLVISDKLFSAHQDHKIRVWKIDNNGTNQQKYTKLTTLPTFGDRALKLLIPKNQVKIRRHKKATWVHHVDTVSALAVSTDGTLLYSVSWDRTLKIWRTSDFKCLESVSNAHDDAINAVTSSPDGSVYTGSSDKKIKVWMKIPGGKKYYLVDTLEQHNSGINALALNPDGSMLYSGACDRSIAVWEKSGGKMVVVGALRGHTKSILCLTVVSDLVCSGSADKTVRIWSCANKSFSCLAVLEGHKGPVKCLAAVVNQTKLSDSDSYLVYSGSLDCDIKLWQVFAHII